MEIVFGRPTGAEAGRGNFRLLFAARQFGKCLYIEHKVLAKLVKRDELTSDQGLGAHGMTIAGR
ncbi:MAG: hypothetical protein JNM13_14960 [Hyphomicrobiaceae bacterium]|nr:hypothetical protein [Hyphomicrobiaceae bacterium]